MAVFNEPQKWAQTLGKDADVTTIPNTAGDTDPSIDKIFPSVFSIPLANGGRAIPRSVLNGLFKLLGDWVYYIQNGGIASYSASFDYAVGSFVKYNDDFYRCIQANSATAPKAPTDSDYWTKIPTLSDFDEISFKTGDIKIHTTSTVPNGWLLCNGVGVSRTNFSNLFAEIGTTYGTGDGSTTFNIPDLRDRYIIGANTYSLGTKIAEQLPNITGSVGRNNYGSGVVSPFSILNEQSGALNYNTNTFGTISTPSGTATLAQKITFNASSSSSIYKASGHVIPSSLALNFIIKT